MSEILRHIKLRHIKQVVKAQAGKRDFEKQLKDWGKNRNKKKIFWYEMVHARLTTRAKVDLVQEFMKVSPFPLAYETVRSKGPKRNVERFIDRVTKKHGFWLHKDIADNLAVNFERLEEGEWPTALRECNRLIKRLSGEAERQETERAVANYLRDTFKGFGPKQSRNLLQMLGLTRYETPIDSRVMNWLNQYLPGDARLTSGMLSRRERYESILDDIQELCRRAKIEPRIFDAAFFSVKDKPNSRKTRLCRP